MASASSSRESAACRGVEVEEEEEKAAAGSTSQGERRATATLARHRRPRLPSRVITGFKRHLVPLQDVI